MTKNFIFTVIAFCIAFFLNIALSPTECVAQLSPWVTKPGAAARQGDMLDAYHTYVKPQTQAAAQMQGLSSALMMGEMQQQDMKGQMDRLLQQPQKKATPMGTRGGAGYRQYLHYYTGLPQGGVPIFGKRR